MIFLEITKRRESCVEVSVIDKRARDWNETTKKEEKKRKLLLTLKNVQKKKKKKNRNFGKKVVV